MSPIQIWTKIEMDDYKATVRMLHAMLFMNVPFFALIQKLPYSLPPLGARDAGFVLLFT